MFSCFFLLQEDCIILLKTLPLIRMLFLYFFLKILDLFHFLS
ncbi:hypothetical protein HMPREF1049_0467 [Fusobacterium necrophorum subsp. funduliforme ATCC 51357]|nr:hypothetical protein HMPREF1049_0467 [Fusobacterium necrophorum subsp. funduliforme ATCC 51357]